MIAFLIFAITTLISPSTSDQAPPAFHKSPMGGWDRGILAEDEDEHNHDSPPPSNNRRSNPIFGGNGMMIIPPKSQKSDEDEQDETPFPPIEDPSSQENNLKDILLEI